MTAARRSTWILIATLTPILGIFSHLAILAVYAPQLVTRGPAGTYPEVVQQDRGGLLPLSDEVRTVSQKRKQPDVVRAVYLTSASAGSGAQIERFIELAKKSGANAFVIDIKSYLGYVAYDADLGAFDAHHLKRIKITDVEDLLNRLHEQDFYVIARIPVFQDSALADARPDLGIHSRYKLAAGTQSSQATLWRDHKGIRWIDPAAQDAWKYAVQLSLDAYKRGFDELNYDYIRFPSDGKLSDMRFTHWDGTQPRRNVIKNFFAYLRQHLPYATLSVDLFGLTTSAADDLGVGQVIEDAYTFFDIVSPMVYPSHYAHGYRGHQNPAAHPYDVVYFSMHSALQRLVAYQSSVSESAATSTIALRPWLQDFTLGAAYDTGMVHTQIQAITDALGDTYRGYMLWNASNKYHWGAIAEE